MLGVPPDAVVLDHLGLNHLTWERAVRVNGVDQLPALLASHAGQLAAEVELPVELLRTLHCVPSYYLRYFYCHDEVVAQSRSGSTRGQRVAQIEADLLAMYADPTLDTKPALLGQRGGAYYSEAAVGLIASLAGQDPHAVHSVNLRNRGTLPFLPDEAVVEVSCTAGTEGPVPVFAGDVAAEQAGLIGHVARYEELALDAALRGGRERVYRALLAHPLVGQHALADGLTDRLLAANAPYLGWLS
jgi:6-phospho-beta-glucosidase